VTSSAILAGFDARTWAGVTLFSRDGDNVAAPAVGTLHDGGHYPDAVAFLNGWAAYRTLSDMLDAQYTGAGTMTAGIDEDGFFWVHVSDPAVNFSVTPGTSDPWGWGGVVAAIAYSGGKRAWTRGPFSASTSAQFSLTHGATTHVMPLYQSTVHALPTWLSGPTTPDDDEVVECLEKWDNVACDAGTKRYRWGIDDEGRTFTSWATGLGALKVPTWSSASFRRALGFTGSETAVLTSGVYTLTSTYPALGVLILRSRLAALDLATEHEGPALELGSGRVAGRPMRHVKDLEVRARLRGGVGLDDTAPHRDEVEIWRHRVSPYLWRGARCTVLPDWSDPRMGRSLVSQMTDAVSSPVLQSAQVVGLAGATMGRKRCEVSSSNSTRVGLTFAPNRPRTRAEGLSLMLRHLPDV
jgi:hypothetical protein